MSDAYEERFTKRLKISEGQPSPSSIGQIYGSVALTVILVDEIYCFMEKKTMLLEQQKGGRKGSMGTADLLYIDRMIMKEVKARKKSIAVAWIDYRKAYDMVPHSWIVECLKSIGINEEIIVFMKECMKS